MPLIFESRNSGRIYRRANYEIMREGWGAGSQSRLRQTESCSNPWIIISDGSMQS
jgi:hypothetical protein